VTSRDHSKTPPERFHHNLVSLAVPRLLRLRILHDLSADHQPFPSNIADDIVLLLHLLQPLNHIVSLSRRVLQEVLVSNRMDDLYGRRTRHRAPTERVRMRTTLPIHQIRVCNSRTDRHTRSQRLRRTENIRLYAPVLDPEPASSPTHPSLHLIVHHKNTILVQELSQSLEVFRRRNNISPLSLNGFDEEGGNVFRREILVQDLFLNEVHAVHVPLR